MFRTCFALIAVVVGTACTFLGEEAQQVPASDHKIGVQPLDRNSDGSSDWNPPEDPDRIGSTFIPLDSWIYPALERLYSLGVVRGLYLGLRPWTRMAVYDAVEAVSDEDFGPQAQDLLSALRTEFRREEELRDGISDNTAIGLDEIYIRTQYISGTPLNDSFHFGQTMVDDFGRPYGYGLQQIAGFEGRAEKGRFSLYVRAEYQHAPSAPGYSQAVNETLAGIDAIPGETFPSSRSSNAFRLLETYVSTKVLGNEISIGKQSYWWGPDDSTALMLSNNVEPLYSIRVNRTTPLHVPLLSKLVGPVRYDNFFGRLSGDQSPRGPFIYGQKISLHPTLNLELGFSRNATFAGEGLEPLTFGTFWNSFTSTSSGTNPGFNPHTTPGARHANFDFSYRLPLLRDWLRLYADSFVHDDVSPVDAPRGAAVVPGIYLSRFPHFHSLDLHVEAGTTDPATGRAKGGRFYYWEALYRDSYLNKRNLLGSWIGREGTGGQSWMTYWIDPRSTVTVGFRSVRVSPFFIPQGETQQDYFGTVNYERRNGMGFQLFLQEERWLAPLLANGAQSDLTAQFGISFHPRNWRWPRPDGKRSSLRPPRDP